MADEVLEALDGGRHHRQLPLLPAVQCVDWAHPRAGDRLVVVVLRGLTRRRNGDEEPGVEATRRFSDGVIQWLTHTRSSIAGRKPVLGTQSAEIDGAVVDGLTVGQRRMAIGDHRAGVVDRQQHTGLFVALADRGDHVRQVTFTVGLVDLAAGEDVHATGERRCRSCGAA